MPVQYHYIQADLTRSEYFEANQAGEIHPAQRRWLEMSVLSLVGWFAYLGVVFASPILCFFATAVLLTAGLSALWVGILAGLAVLCVLAYTFVRGSEFRQEQKHVQGDLSAARLTQAEGQLTFQRGHYEFQADGQLLKLPGLRGELLPGVRYQVFYLSESRVVLSARALEEPLSAAADSPKSATGLAQVLCQALGSQLDSLEDNRRGELAADQARVLKAMAWRGAVWMLGCGALAGYLIALLFNSPGRGDVGWWLGLLLVVGLGGYLIYGGVIQLVRILGDLSEARVIFVDGVGKKVLVNSSSSLGRPPANTSLNHYYLVGQRRFSIPPRLSAALMDGLRYRAYFTPRSQRLVAIEPLEMI